MRKLIVLLFLTSCMVGPNYQKPKEILPTSYVETKKNSSSITSLKGWWETFNDPQLEELVNKAIVKNYNLKIAIEKIEQARAFLNLKKADLFPEIDLNAAALRERMSKNLLTTSFLPTTTWNRFLMGFDALWEIDLFGKLRREKEAALYAMQSEEENMRNVFITLISDVAKNYVDICALNNLIELTEKRVKLQKSIFSLTENRSLIGLDSQIEKEVALSQLKEDEENILFYNTLIKQDVYRLALLLGENPESFSYKWTTSKNIPSGLQKISANIPSELLRRRPDIRMAERTLASKTAMIGAAIAEYFPSFSLTGGTSFSSNKLSNFFQKNSLAWSFGAAMGWPLIDFGRVRAKVDISKSEEKQALYYYENTILQALQEVESAFVVYYNQKETLLDVQKELLAISTKTSLEKDKYSSGLTSELNFLYQDKELVSKQMKEVDASRALTTDLIALYKSLGGGEWESRSLEK